MTEEQKKAIDACKDQAAQEYMLNSFHDVHYGRSETLQNVTNAVVTRAMQLYGEQCRKEAYTLGWNNRGLPSWQHPPLLPEN